MQDEGSILTKEGLEEYDKSKAWEKVRAPSYRVAARDVAAQG